MKRFIKTLCVVTLLAGLAFSANKRILKSEFKMDRMKRVEPDYRRGVGTTRVDCPHQYPRVVCEEPGNPCPAGEICIDADGGGYCFDEGTGLFSVNPNTEVTVIDSSANGYGMVATVTRPMDVNSDGNMLVVYRQYALQENTTHGQLGAGYGVVTDGAIQWDVQWNVNYNGNPPWGTPGGGGVGGIGCSQARYPSGIASEDYPYAVWNEYTGGPPTNPTWPSDCSDYGGRPYFSYDEFGWGGESWLYPAELDPLYACTKDLWQGSVGYGYDETNEAHHVSVVYDDWTRTGSYLFTSEAVEDGYIVLGTETLIVNPQHLGTDGYSSSAILSMNGNGQGILGIDGIFAGNDMDAGTCGPPASNLTCNKTPMFKVTDNFGQSWAGNHAAFDFYFVPDEVFNDIFQYWPNEDIDACTGETSFINDFWSWYEFDMRVDNDGNPHIVISLIAESDNYFHFLDGYTGFYHLTIDRDNLGSPGPVNSTTGWNWSYIPLPANDSFEWNRPDGFSYLYGSMCQMAISRENDDIVYMVANIATEGTMSAAHDANGDGIEDDPCGTQNSPYELYPNWSEDIWVAKSSDNGSTWTGLENLTNTPKPDDGLDFAGSCSPEEQYVHSAHWADDYRVYYQYNQPNWGFNEIGDPLGADHMNRVFLGYAYVEETGVGGCTDSGNCSYDPEAAFENGSCGSGIYTCGDGTSGCGCDDVCGDTLDPPAVVDCDGVCDGGAVTLCNSVESGGGEYCDNTGTEVCTETSFDDGECTDLNEWNDCNSDHCGIIDPLFGCGGMITWDGGRCYTCSDPAYIVQGDCSGAGEQWQVDTVGDCDENDYGCEDLYDNYDPTSCPTYNLDCDNNIPGNSQDPDDCLGDGWVPFMSDGDDANGEETDGPADECSCTASDAAQYAELACVVGDVNGDGSFNVLDIVNLANCVLNDNCDEAADGGCAADVNGDGNYNVLDIVNLANCVLNDNCGGRVSDASESKLIILDNMVSIDAEGFIGGVQMTLSHKDNFSIEMTEDALLADYRTSGYETKLLVITPETKDLFSFEGDFEITEIIVANSHAEISVEIPNAVDPYDAGLITEFSLSTAYPNPFNPTTIMTLAVPKSGHASVQIYNLAGQVVATLVSGYIEANTYKTVTWNASNVASGMYFVKAEAEGFVATQKLMLIK